MYVPTLSKNTCPNFVFKGFVLSPQMISSMRSYLEDHDLLSSNEDCFVAKFLI
jgi:hypothetical protein